jgi:putative metallopeptidase DUF4344
MFAKVIFIMLLLFSGTMTTTHAEIRVSYPTVKNPQHEQVRQSAIKAQVIEQWVSKINEHLKQPIDLTVSMVECGQQNAYYEPKSHQIIMCYEMLDEISRLVHQNAAANEVNVRISGAWTFIFYHELGHAFVDLFNLPIVGSEEDAVDQFATIFVADGKEPNREEMAMSGAWVFWWLLPFASQYNFQFGFGNDPDREFSFADSHGLGQQRFYSILCLLYGNDPQRYQGYIAQIKGSLARLDPRRAQFCAYEYRKIKRNWVKLTDDYFTW